MLLVALFGVGCCSCSNVSFAVCCCWLLKLYVVVAVGCCGWSVACRCGLLVVVGCWSLVLSVFVACCLLCLVGVCCVLLVVVVCCLNGVASAVCSLCGVCRYCCCVLLLFFCVVAVCCCLVFVVICMWY